MAIKLIIKDSLEDKIRFMCNELPDTEWSGSLFYRVEGSLAKKNLRLIAEDFCLLDVGTSGYTEFTESPEIIGYMADNDLTDCYISLIHSHHNMGTHFSSTDMNTLHKNGNDSNHFLSLIVNNVGQYSAKLTTKVVSEITETITTCKTFGNKDVTYKTTSRKTSFLRIDDLEIVKRTLYYQDLHDKIKDLKKAKTKIKNSLMDIEDVRAYTDLREPRFNF